MNVCWKLCKKQAAHGRKSNSRHAILWLITNWAISGRTTDEIRDGGSRHCLGGKTTESLASSFARGYWGWI